MTDGLLSRFQGTWHLVREIEDFRSGKALPFDGTARFDATGPHTMLLSESGWLTTLQGGRVHAERSYVWRSGENRIDVFFDDGRPFHSFDPRQSDPSALHDCAPDRYEVTYQFADWPVWQMIWRVRGPRKDYRSVSRFSRP